MAEAKSTDKPSTADTSQSNRPAERKSTNTQPTTGVRLNPVDGEPGETTYHCGYCGEAVNSEGAHTDAVTGELRMPNHAGTLVVADNWPALQDAQDEKKVEEAEKARQETAKS